MMFLDEYLFRNRMKISEFAKIIDFDPVYISSVKTQKRSPGPKFRRAVQKATNGQVKFPLPVKSYTYRNRKYDENRQDDRQVNCPSKERILTES